MDLVLSVLDLATELLTGPSAQASLPVGSLLLAEVPGALQDLTLFI